MIHFDPTITFGNLLTVVAILGTFFLAWHNIRIELVELKSDIKTLLSWKDNVDGKYITKEVFDMLRVRFEKDHHWINNIRMRLNMADKIEVDQ